MASAFGHAAAAFAISRTGLVKPTQRWLLFCGIVLSILPDADSIGFALGVPYDSPMGHRGFTHSIFFAAIMAVLCAAVFFRKNGSKAMGRAAVFLFLSCISHAVLDAMTTGGLGVAFFAPFNNTRYFFGFRPIRVSPISVSSFFKGSGLAVLKSEAVWIGIPTMAIYLYSLLIAWFNKNENPKS